MMIKPLITCIGIAALLGCSGNPTNEPSAADIQKANEARAAAIDNDPSITPEGKAKMKEMLKLGPRGADQKR